MRWGEHDGALQPVPLGDILVPREGAGMVEERVMRRFYRIKAVVANEVLYLDRDATRWVPTNDPRRAMIFENRAHAIKALATTNHVWLARGKLVRVTVRRRS